METKDIKNWLLRGDNITICGHVNPDNDSFYAGCALSFILKNYYDKNVNYLISGVSFPRYKDYAKRFGILPRSTNIVKYDFPQRDALVLVDLNTSSRTNPENECLDLSIFQEVIVIDHHLEDNSEDAWITAKFIRNGTTCGHVFNIFQNEIGEMKKELRVDFINGLLMGVLDDLKMFAIPYVTSEDLKLVSQMMDMGGDFNSVTSLLQRRSFGYYRYISKLYKIVKRDSVGFHYLFLRDAVLPKETELRELVLNNFKFRTSFIDEVEVIFYIKEGKTGTYKVTMRSKHNLTNLYKEIIKSGLGSAGGHPGAGGAVIQCSTDAKLIKILGDIVNESEILS